jgi:hypothetical protein
MKPRAEFQQGPSILKRKFARMKYDRRNEINAKGFNRRFNPKDGGSMSLPIDGLQSEDYVTQQPRRSPSKLPPP